MIGLLLYQCFQIIFVIKDLLEVLFDRGYYSLVMFIALLVRLVLLLQGLEFIFNFNKFCIDAWQRLIQIVNLRLRFVIGQDQAFHGTVFGLKLLVQLFELSLWIFDLTLEFNNSFALAFWLLSKL